MKLNDTEPQKKETESESGARDLFPVLRPWKFDPDIDWSLYSFGSHCAPFAPAGCDQGPKHR